MSRYIDADALRKRMLAVFEDNEIGVVLNGYWSSKLVRDIIDDQPTADVVEVVHGEWVDVNGDGSLLECRNCHERSCCKGNYCLNCGAKMDGER